MRFPAIRNPFKPVEHKPPSAVIKKATKVKLSEADTPQARRREKISTEEIRELRELIRQRYALDLRLWSHRTVNTHNEEPIMKKARQADALMLKIRAIVTSMDKRKYFETDEEWRVFAEIRNAVMEDGKREWVKNPPWKDRNYGITD